MQEVVQYIAHKLNHRVKGFLLPVRSDEQYLAHQVAVEAHEAARRKHRSVVASNDYVYMHPAVYAAGKTMAHLGWMSLKELVARDPADNVWFRSVLRLFCQLCDGKNIGTVAAICYDAVEYEI